MPRWFFYSFLVVLAALGLSICAPLAEDEGVQSAAPYSSEALNALVGTMLESDVDTATNNVHISGIAPAGADWSERLQTFRNSLADGVSLDLDVFVLNTTTPLAELCKGMFEQVDDATISFGQSGSSIRSSSYAALGRIAEFARDCPDSTIAITGHSDSSGLEANNKALSQARAQAVADFLAAHGASNSQLLVAGAGSDFPIADDATSQGRARNRRIEFELREVQ